MMKSLICFVLGLVLVVAVLPVFPGQAMSVLPDIDESNCINGLNGVYGLQSSGAKYCMIVPLNWNHDLVIFAHGYVDPTITLTNPEFTDQRIPYEQLILPGNTMTIPGMITQLGYAFAITGYSKNGLAVQEGVADVIDLAENFKLQHPDTRWIYLVGASEGGLVTTLTIEKNPNKVFSGGVADCGPIGDFNKQIGSWGDFRVIYDYFFGNQIPGPNAITIPPDFDYNTWRQYTAQEVASLVVPVQNPGALATTIYLTTANQLIGNPELGTQLVQVTGAAVDPNDLLNSTLATTLGILSYNVLASNDGTQELKGIPYNNLDPLTTYTGSVNDTDLNEKVERIGPISPTTAAELMKYQTTGVLGVPLITMHDTGDPIVPFWHEGLYQAKLDPTSASYFTSIPIDRYGHCNFKNSEMLFSFWLLVLKSNSVLISPTVAAAVLPDQEQRTEFLSMVAPYISTVYIPIVDRP
jgi:pimeloyl-ACP methyl ester carboxylesterase